MHEPVSASALGHEVPSHSRETALLSKLRKIGSGPAYLLLKCHRVGSDPSSRRLNMKGRPRSNRHGFRLARLAALAGAAAGSAAWGDVVVRPIAVTGTSAGPGLLYDRFDEPVINDAGKV